MKILIIEDERSNADRLVRLLGNITTPSNEVIGVANSNREAMAMLQSDAFAPDVILADIQLGDGLSFEALQTAPPNIPVVFTTAYDQYAIQAFGYNGIAYLLKPIDPEELAEALQQVAERQHRPTDTDQLRELLTALRQNGIRYRERFLIPFRDELKVVSVREVSHIALVEGGVYLFTNTCKMHPLGYTLEEMEAQLDPQRFMRVNRQYIVNVDSVQSLVSHFLGKMKLYIRGYADTEVIISRAKVPVVKKWLDF